MKERVGGGESAIMPSPGIMNIKDAAEVGRPVLNNPVKGGRKIDGEGVRWGRRKGVRNR